MNSVYFPLQVVILLRRLANAISAFSISNHYLHKAKSSIEVKDQQDPLCHTPHCDRAVQLEHTGQHLNDESSSPVHNPHMPRPKHDELRDSIPMDTIHQLLANPALYDPLRVPRYPIVLSHGG